MGYIFISYSHKDKAYVDRLYDALIKEGFTPWIDHRINYGSKWPDEIRDRLDACDAFIVVVSENSYASSWVQKEVIRANAKKKPIFPLLLEGDGDKWFAIQDIQYVDVRGEILPPKKFYDDLSRVASIIKKPLLLPRLTPSIKEPPKLTDVKSKTEKSSKNENNYYSKRKARATAFLIIFVSIAFLIGTIYLRNNYLNNSTQVQATSTPTTLAPLSPQDALDKSLGITRFQFTRAFSVGLGIQISQMIANETGLYLLNSETGSVMRAVEIDGQGYQVDNSFICAPGQYGDTIVGSLVDILALPGLNSINASLLGIDRKGNLLYCAPGQMAQVISLQPPDTNWGSVTAFTIDAGNLYVLDTPARAVWIYVGKDGVFNDKPYFFFSGKILELQNVIDLIVRGDDLLMLDTDGHFSICSYNHFESVPTTCNYLSELPNPFPSYKDTNLFTKAYITQMTFATPPDTSIFLLDTASKGVLYALYAYPRTMELKGQFRSVIYVEYNPLSSGLLSAIAVSPNHVLYLAVDDQIYYATGIP